MPKVIQKPVAGKSLAPKKPYAEFPLFPHATRRWAKKIRGKLHYFGPWADPNKALNTYLEKREDLHAGRTPRVSGAGVTVRDLVNRFLTAKKGLLESGELSDKTFVEWYSAGELMVKSFGRNRLVDDLAADDFDKLRRTMAKAWGPARLGKMIQLVRSIAKYGFEAGVIDKPVRYGPLFKKPAKVVLRKLRAEKGSRMFEADQLLKVLNAATNGVKATNEDGTAKDDEWLIRPNRQLAAMILLGVNCGFGNSDVASLDRSAVDLKRGWINFPRPKTGVDRRCPLWPETVAALAAVEAERPTAKTPEAANLFFVTRCGSRWGSSRLIEKENAPTVLITDDPVAKEFTKIIKALKLHRRGLGFYALRHGFETIAGGSRDQVGTDAIMGHSRNDMASVYRERIDDDRLLAVVNYVHAWLWPVIEQKIPT